MMLPTGTSPGADIRTSTNDGKAVLMLHSPTLTPVGDGTDRTHMELEMELVIVPNTIGMTREIL